ncbi:MAG: hypothetical protein M9936_32880 [Caldilinea sp.]|nr:hypothetical protein [Caldilinea sp.]
MTSGKQVVEKALLALGAPHVVTSQDIEAYARVSAGVQPSSATLTRWVRALTETGALQQVSRGVYLNRMAGPAVHAAEAAQYIRRGAVVSLAWVLERSGALNNFGDTVTCVVPQISGMAPPKVGERDTAAGAFRFYAMPGRFFDVGSTRVEDMQDLHYSYPRATPERALLDWIYLGASARSRLPLPPLDVQLRGMSRPRLSRVARAMGIEAEWQRWYADWSAHEAAADVRDNASAALGF